MFSHFVPADMGGKNGGGEGGWGETFSIFQVFMWRSDAFWFVLRILCSIISASRLVFRWLFAYFVVLLLLLGSQVVYVVPLCLEMFLIGG